MMYDGGKKTSFFVLMVVNVVVFSAIFISFMIIALLAALSIPGIGPVAAAICTGAAYAAGAMSIASLVWFFAAKAAKRAYARGHQAGQAAAIVQLPEGAAGAHFVQLHAGAAGGAVGGVQVQPPGGPGNGFGNIVAPGANGATGGGGQWF